MVAILKSFREAPANLDELRRFNSSPAAPLASHNFIALLEGALPFAIFARLLLFSRTLRQWCPPGSTALNLSDLVGFVGDKFSKIGGCHRHCNATWISERSLILESECTPMEGRVWILQVTLVF